MNTIPFEAPAEIVSATKIVPEIVARGGVVMVPTESYYGLAADPRLAGGVEAIQRAKGRPTEMGMPVLCADWQQLESLVRVPEAFRVKLSRIWPAALTVILPVVEPIAGSVGGTLAVRIPDHGPLRAVLYRSGPLTGTSANGHGAPPNVTIDDALRTLVRAPDLALDGGTTAGGEPSTIVDLTSESARIVRSGRVAWDDPPPDC